MDRVLKEVALSKTSQLRRTPRIILLVSVVVVIAFAAALLLRTPEPSKQSEMGLVTSLPIYWGQGEDFTALLDDKTPLPWPRTIMEQRYTLRPLDRIANEGAAESDPMQGLERLLIVQPRGLAPDENVALDDWVNAGGRLLYVIDPLLSGHYELPIGDPRLPSLVGLVPPVLPRWGVSMSEREGEGDEAYILDSPIGPLPVMRAGALVATDNPTAICTIAPSRLVADCEVGKGRVIVLADATLFELQEGNSEQEERLLALLDHAFD